MVYGDKYIPPADSTLNKLQQEVIGNKEDTALQVATAVDSMMRYLKGLITALGNPTANVLASIATKLGNNATDFATEIGYEGATSLANKLTAVRAALLDQITALRMAELDPANLPTDIAALNTLLSDGTYGLAALEALVDDLETRLSAVRAGYLDNIDTKAMGRSQIAATTIDLNQAAATYDLFTGTDQVVILESLNIKMPTGAAGGALTSISIQTDDVTPGVIISSVDGDVANLTSEADLGWTGTLYITVGTKIRLTIAGGAHGAGYVCKVTAKSRAVVSGGYLA